MVVSPLICCLILCGLAAVIGTNFRPTAWFWSGEKVIRPVNCPGACVDIDHNLHRHRFGGYRIPSTQHHEVQVICVGGAETLLADRRFCVFGSGWVPSLRLAANGRTGEYLGASRIESQCQSGTLVWGGRGRLRSRLRNVETTTGSQINPGQIPAAGSNPPFGEATTGGGHSPDKTINLGNETQVSIREKVEHAVGGRSGLQHHPADRAQAMMREMEIPSEQTVSPEKTLGRGVVGAIPRNKQPIQIVGVHLPSAQILFPLAFFVSRPLNQDDTLVGVPMYCCLTVTSQASAKTEAHTRAIEHLEYVQTQAYPARVRLNKLGRVGKVVGSQAYVYAEDFEGFSLRTRTLLGNNGVRELNCGFRVRGT